MSSLSRNEHSKATFTSAPAGGLATSQVTQQSQLQFPTNSRSRSQSPQSQSVYPWSAHAPPFGQSPSPFLRESHTLSTSSTAAGEMFLFGGYAPRSKSLSNDLYVILTRNLSTTLLETSGDVPGPRFGHCAVLTSTILLIWGGRTGTSDQSPDDSFYLLNLGTLDFDVKTRSS
jgi:hypothetical protein